MEANNKIQAATETSDIPIQEKLRYVTGPHAKIFRGNSITLNLSSELSKTLNEVMIQTDYWPDEIFARALILYKAAIDADRAGKRVVILDTDDEIDQEVINL